MATLFIGLYATYKINAAMDILSQKCIKLLEWKDKVVDNTRDILNENKKQQEKIQRENYRNKVEDIKQKYNLK